MRTFLIVMTIVCVTPAYAWAKTCKDIDSCREAVELWCGGYKRADADKDGIPCENICRTREQVRKIQAEIGCTL